MLSQNSGFDMDFTDISTMDDSEDWDVVSEGNTESAHSDNRDTSSLDLDKSPFDDFDTLCFDDIPESEQLDTSEEPRNISEEPIDTFEENLSSDSINLDSFIPKPVDLTHAKSVELDSIIETSNLAKNMEHIESVGSQIEDLLNLLGNI